MENELKDKESESEKWIDKVSELEDECEQAWKLYDMSRAREAVLLKVISDNCMRMPA